VSFFYEIDAAMRDWASVWPIALSNHKDDHDSKEDTDPEYGVIQMKTPQMGL